MQKKFFWFLASPLSLTSGKNFMVIGPVVSEILGGDGTTPQMLLHCQKEQMLLTVKSYNKLWKPTHFQKISLKAWKSSTKLNYFFFDLFLGTFRFLALIRMGGHCQSISKLGCKLKRVDRNSKSWYVTPYNKRWESSPIICYLQSSSVIFVFYRKGRNFCEFFFGHFGGSNFRERSFTKDFAEIKSSRIGLNQGFRGN